MENENKEGKEVKEDEEEGPPPGYQTILSLQKPEPESHSQPPPSPSQVPPSSPPTQHQTITPPPTPKIAQIVCGSCRRLLKYPPAARQVQCSCCQIVNFVLQAHEVGQVKCGSCMVLLMYPYGALQVRCCSCQFVTEIGAHNQRPPWSVQQGQPLPCPNPSQ